jgi:hypothetical protein
MNGFPIEKSKALARKAIAGMRANDTFNIITFAGATSVLWSEPKPATDENKRAADDFVNGAYGSGGTEMMTAINAALVQDGRSGLKPAKLLDLPADGRGVRIVVDATALVRAASGWKIDAGAGRSVNAEIGIAIPANAKNAAIILDGTWETRDADRVFVAKSARFEDADARTRYVFFLTDGYIGNDQAVVQAVRDNARASRVFTFGIGNSVNRSLLEQMARAGRGVCEVVTLSEEADGVVERLARRIESPVLTDIELDVPPELGLRDILPAGEHLPDLYDEEPIVLLGRFDRAASGSITLRGRTGAGAWERTVAVSLPAEEARHDVVPTLWARAKVDVVLAGVGGAEGANPRVEREIVRLGETYRIATPFTSFVAVEKSRVVVGGRPMLVSVPVELPDGTNWEGFFESFDAIERVAAFGRGDGSAVRGAIEAITGKARARGLLAPIAERGGLIGSAEPGGRDDKLAEVAQGSTTFHFGAMASGGSAVPNNAPTGGMVAPSASAPAPALPPAGLSGAGGGAAKPSAPPPPPTSSAAPTPGAAGKMVGGLGGGGFAKGGDPAVGNATDAAGETRAKSVAPPGRLLERQRAMRSDVARQRPVWRWRWRGWWLRRRWPRWRAVSRLARR